MTVDDRVPEDSMEIAGLLEAVSSVSSSETCAAWLAVAALRAWEHGSVPTSRVVTFLDRNAGSLDRRFLFAYGVSDKFDDAARGVYGTVEHVEREMRASERALRDWLATSSSCRRL